MRRGKKEPADQPKVQDNQTLLKWLKSRKKRQQQQDKQKVNTDSSKEKPDEQKSAKTKKITKAKKGADAQVKSKAKNASKKKAFKKSKEEEKSEEISNQEEIQGEDSVLNENQVENKAESQRQQELPMEQENQEIQENAAGTEDVKVVKKGKGKKKKGKGVSIQKVSKKEQRQSLDYQTKYPYLFSNEEVSSTQYIFDKFKPDALERFRKDHQDVMEIEQQEVEEYEQYPAEQKQKPVKIPLEPLPDGRRYQVPIKVCTCCNFFGKRHLCAHDLCAKPCPVEHRKTKIRDRYFERYKNRPKADNEYDDQE